MRSCVRCFLVYQGLFYVLQKVKYWKIATILFKARDNFIFQTYLFKIPKSNLEF